MMMLLSRMISTAARCSDVCGCGHDSFPANGVVWCGVVGCATRR